MKIGIYTLTSPLHDEKALNTASATFLEEIGENLESYAEGNDSYELVFKGSDYSDFGTDDLDVIYVRTGGTEGLFKQIFDKVRTSESGYGRPVRLLTSGKSNSLAASMEIMSFLRQNECSGEIIHGSCSYIAGRLALLTKVDKAKKKLQGTNLGVIGQPSDWLISSGADYTKVKKKTGITLVDIPISELIEEIAKKEYPSNSIVKAAAEKAATLPEKVKPYWEDALNIYGGLKRIIEKHKLSGLTIRCFDLLEAIGNTGCLALAILNSEGIPAGCEGDIPALLTMAVSQAVTGSPGFQCNPSRIDPETGEILLAHCTIPLNMVRSYSFDTHFESGIGVAIHGEVLEGDVTVFKLSGDLSRCFISEASLLKNQYKQDLCRTQIVLHTEDISDYFLKNPIGNHQIVLSGHHKTILQAFFEA